MASNLQPPTAKLQWWDQRNMHVLCPWCDEIHHHGLGLGGQPTRENFLSQYARRHSRVAHCDPVRNGKVWGMRYNIEFPIGASPDAAGYEIDKTGFRFVAGGAHLTHDDTLPDNEREQLRAFFKEKINLKRRWSEAVETEIVFEDFSLKKLVTVTSEMVQGNVPFVQEYLETSPEADILLYGVQSWEVPSDVLDEDTQGEEEKELILETSGTTALHMTACESHVEMVKLLLSKGADPNATDLSGRTALMEAAIWGRLENVELLLEYGADKSLECLDEGRLWKAVDLAKPLRKHAWFRRQHEGYKEDVYARDRDRQDIGRLLGGATEEQPQPQLDGFVFRPSPDSPMSLSLTTYYNLPHQWKAVAHMFRGGALPEVSAMSGWSHTANQGYQVAGKDWTDEVLRLCEVVGYAATPDYRDGGLPGRFNACHAEKQLVAYFVHNHLFLPHDIDVHKGSEYEEKDDMASMMRTLNLDHQVLERQQREQAEKCEKQATKRRLRSLWKARPANFLKEAIIMISTPECGDCKAFVAQVNRALELRLQVRHCCLDGSCRTCCT